MLSQNTKDSAHDNKYPLMMTAYQLKSECTSEITYLWFLIPTTTTFHSTIRMLFSHTGPQFSITMINIIQVKYLHTQWQQRSSHHFITTDSYSWAPLHLFQPSLPPLGSLHSTLLPSFSANTFSSCFRKSDVSPVEMTSISLATFYKLNNF